MLAVERGLSGHAMMEYTQNARRGATRAGAT